MLHTKVKTEKRGTLLLLPQERGPPHGFPTTVARRGRKQIRDSLKASSRNRGTEGLNGKIQDVFKMPPLTACQANAIGEPVNLRIQSKLEPEEETKPVIDMTSDTVLSMSSLIYKNMDRWKKI
ncbi:protein lin-37 homolog isoform X2 [Anolis sagrei]|uniref:protein lin-37 homolog isoform X2 n=1 Tax=Anolis sagrei TaxID=38937 RepID=UPI00351FC208